MTGVAMLKAAGLWEKTSAKGNRYLVGRLGGVKILILANLDYSAESNPTHHLFFVEAAERPREARQSPRTTADNSTTSPSRQEPRRRSPYRERKTQQDASGSAPDPRPFNDEIPF
jgi:hypothetical protein